jgi:UDP-N-acetylglucosamine 2-epimerase (non-hydrolysing)
MLAGSILLCMGTRPEIIKMAPVYHALAARNLRPMVLHTGQHEELAHPVYAFFGITPTLSLNLTRERQSLSHLSALVVDKVGLALELSRPNAVLVHGDTSSALMAALAAFYEQISVGHVEAGLRSHNQYDPFPEEQNRVLVARLARWHFAPTAQAVRNLIEEHIAQHSVHMVGNTVVDAVGLGSRILDRDGYDIDQLSQGALRDLPDVLRAAPRLVLVTAHRRENLGQPIANIAQAVARLLAEHADMTVVWPLHSNPAVQDNVKCVLHDLPPSSRRRLFLINPQSYAALLWLLRHAWLVLTDSGGIQEEAASLHVPILVLRQTTERPEVIDGGNGMLVGTDPDRIIFEVGSLLADSSLQQAMIAAVNPFGDGFAAGRIAAVLERDLATTEVR